MISYQKYILDNGLKVILHEDKSSPLVAVNTLYRVGSKDEHPDKTGFAHLFEHLMFGGSENVPDFDTPIQMAGGENNAFTNSDITNYYNLVPAENLETVLWLESDRMNQLDFSKKSLDTQKKVVVEEFKETCLNKPYGDVWHALSKLAFKDHAYQWPTIGKVPSHISDATMEDVKGFFYNFYRPNNAILVISGNFDYEEAKLLVDKWFSAIPMGKVERMATKIEALQTEKRTIELKAEVPSEAFYLAFHMPGRLDKDYCAVDLISDVFASGRSSRFHQELFKKRQMFSTIDAYISGTIDPGLFIIEAKPMPGYSIEQGMEAVWGEIRKIQEDGVSEEELVKLQNKMESSLVYSEINILNKAMNLAYFEHIGSAQMINEQAQAYNKVTKDQIQEAARKYLHMENCSELKYYPI